MITMVNIECEQCNVVFLKIVSQVNWNKKKGRKNCDL